jgi:hypothetical protein
LKTLIITLFCISTFSITTAQETNLIGTWNIIEFEIINENNSNKTTKDQLKENESVWDLVFIEKGKFKQSSNMHSGNLESQDGTWEILDNNLKLTLLLNGNEIELGYEYELKNNILTLKRSNPLPTIKIVSKFNTE